MIYKNGLRCPGGQQRELNVVFYCGKENDIFSVIKTGTSTIFTDSALIILTIACFMLTLIFSQQWPMIGLGVLFYGCGLPFYFKDETKWAHLIWHLFVIAGWLTHLFLEIHVRHWGIATFSEQGGALGGNAGGQRKGTALRESHGG